MLSGARAPEIQVRKADTNIKTKKGDVPLAGSGSASALPGGHKLCGEQGASRVPCGRRSPRPSKPQVGGLNDDAGGTWNTLSAWLPWHGPHLPLSSSTPIPSDLTPLCSRTDLPNTPRVPAPPGNGLPGTQHSRPPCRGPLPGRWPIRGPPTPHLVASASQECRSGSVHPPVGALGLGPRWDREPPACGSPSFPSPLCPTFLPPRLLASGLGSLHPFSGMDLGTRVLGAGS